MENFTPIESLVGGLLIGISSAIVLLVLRRIVGISGVLGGALTRPGAGDLAWRLWFLAGLVAVGAVVYSIAPSMMSFDVVRSDGAIIVAGLLVGFGTRLGNGCTSGHGVCGIGRLSPRSLMATMTFVGIGFVTVYIVQSAFGGAL